MDAPEEPAIEAQAAAYQQVLAAFAGRKVVVRTLDAGADKPLAYANQRQEANPALGQRAYRLVRSVPQLLGNQLTALATAVAATPQTETWVMAPMISTAAEARDFHVFLDEPYSGLDPHAVEIFDSLIAEVRGDRTFVMVTSKIGRASCRERV